MGIYDRDYTRPPGGGMMSAGGGGGSSGMFMRNPGWSVTTWLILINVAIHLLVITVMPVLWEIGYLSVQEAFGRLKVWRLITFQFLHDPGSIWHLALNMFGMWVFGPIVEEFLGRKKYLAFYLTCGLFGGLLFVVLSLLGNATGGAVPGLLTNDLGTPLIGASAGVFGVIVACAYIAPNTVVQLLFPPIPLKLKYFAYGYVGLALIQLLGGAANAGGEAAHLGGAIAGYYFIRNSHMLTDFFDVFKDSRQQKPKGRTRSTRGGVSDAEIDRILDKVSRSGIGSLTEKEKRALNDASREQRQAG